MGYGLMGGLLWALDTVLLGLVLNLFQTNQLAPFIATGLHDLLSAVFLVALALVHALVIRLKKSENRRRQSITKKSFLLLVLAGVLGGPIGMGGYVLSIQYLGAGLSAVLSCLYPVAGAVLERIIFKTKFSARQIIGLCGAIGGVMALSMSGLSGITNLAAGLLCSAVCVAGWSLEGIVAQAAMKDGSISNRQALLFRQSTSALVFTLVIFPLIHGWPTALSMAEISISMPFIGGSSLHISILLLAALAGTMSYLNYYQAIHLLGAGKAMPLNITYAAWALVFSFLILHVIPSAVEIICALVILASAILCAASAKEAAGKGNARKKEMQIKGKRE